MIHARNQGDSEELCDFSLDILVTMADPMSQIWAWLPLQACSGLWRTCEPALDWVRFLRSISFWMCDSRRLSPCGMAPATASYPHRRASRSTITLTCARLRPPQDPRMPARLRRHQDTHRAVWIIVPMGQYRIDRSILLERTQTAVMAVPLCSPREDSLPDSQHSVPNKEGVCR